MFEIGIPAALAGGVAGFLVGWGVAMTSRHGRVD
jgi:hypothetical protein